MTVVGASEVEAERALRLRFLCGVYEATRGDEAAMADLYQVAAGLGMADDALYRVIQYLQAERWLLVASLDGRVRLTHDGILQAEAALARQRLPATSQACLVPLGPASIQAGGPPLDGVVDLVFALRERMDQLEIGLELWRDLREQLATIERQLGAEDPRPGVLREALGSVRRVLEQAAGSTTATVLTNQVSRLLGA
ncbi:MAG: hypothetical protein ACPGQL_02495 [Thermoplasmatota archaeon]